MKKNLMFVIPMIAIAVLLFLLRTTGMTAHIIVSVIGLALLVAYAVTTKKSWKCPVLEVLMRVCYAVALISGVALMNVHGIAVIAVAHKVGAILFTMFLIITEVHKVIKK